MLNLDSNYCRTIKGNKDHKKPFLFVFRRKITQRFYHTKTPNLFQSPRISPQMEQTKRSESPASSTETLGKMNAKFGQKKVIKTQRNFNAVSKFKFEEKKKSMLIR